MRIATRVLVTHLIVLAVATAAARAQSAQPPNILNADRVAELLHQRYPRDLQQLGVGGTIKLRVRVIPRGVADSMEVASSTGVPALDDAARSVVRAFTFSTVPEPTWRDVSLTFEPDVGAAARYSDLPVLTNRETVVAGALSNLPERLRKSDVRVETALMVSVDSAGKPADIRVLQPNCQGEFDGAARKALSEALFAPATGSAPAARKTIVTFSFDPPGLTMRLPGEGHLVASETRIPTAAFTPYTKAPSLRNPEQVRANLTRHYPRELLSSQLGGTVQVWLFVDEKGKVQRRMVRTSSGNCSLDRAALLVSQTMLFDPALRGDQPTRVWVDMPIIFKPFR